MGKKRKNKSDISNITFRIVIEESPDGKQEDLPDLVSLMIDMLVEQTINEQIKKYGSVGAYLEKRASDSKRRKKKPKKARPKKKVPKSKKDD